MTIKANNIKLINSISVNKVYLAVNLEKGDLNKLDVKLTANKMDREGNRKR